MQVYEDNGRNYHGGRFKQKFKINSVQFSFLFLYSENEFNLALM